MTGRTGAGAASAGGGTPVGALLERASVVVCCGAGGVGKTTTAAALGVAAAERGRRVCVVTVDPARRLADALGGSGVGNEPRRIPGPWPGTLSAVMLDARGTFDELVRREAKDPVQAERILSNRLYRNLVSALSGTQEYMATEKLFELHEDPAFDLVVVDTPPTRNALDFLDAPRRLTGFLDNRVFRLVVSPGRAYLRAVSMASQVLLRTIAKVAGSEIVDDAVAFFQAFEGMEAGFRSRAAKVEQLLAEDATGFVVVAAPRRDSVAEASFFAERLAEGHHDLDVVVVNRVLPRFDLTPSAWPAGEWSAEEDAEGARPGGGGEAAGPEALAALEANLEQLARLAASEAALVDELTERLAPAPVQRVPYLGLDVHDLDTLAILARQLAPADGLASGHGEDRPGE
ncbi:MAG: AAA family ATPase [Actinomycetota bacterium]|nr:AAA family ATPase [Actinomycetota bacterium]